MIDSKIVISGNGAIRNSRTCIARCAHARAAVFFGDIAIWKRCSAHHNIAHLAESSTSNPVPEIATHFSYPAQVLSFGVSTRHKEQS